MTEDNLPEPGRPTRRPGAVVSRVRASWQRSKQYGAPLDTVDPVFTGSIDDQSLFFECGNEVLHQLHETLIDEPVSLILTDSDGLILSRVSGDSALVRALDTVYLAPGFTFSEREAGTNGLGLALADRVPALVRAEEHYCSGLQNFTCAAVPVHDPLSGRLLGSVNLSTWSRTSSGLLLAVAQSAATSTTSLILARSSGRTPRAAPRGEVFRVEPARLINDDQTLTTLSAAWSAALDEAESAVRSGRVVAVVGEPGAGRSSLLALAHRRVCPRSRILSAAPPAPQDTERWLSLWTPEIAKSDTEIIVRDVDSLSRSAATQLSAILNRLRSGASPTRDASSDAVPQHFSVTAENYGEIESDLASHVDTVVRVPPLRERLDDVEPLARHFTRQFRGRELTFTPVAIRALSSFHWPGNVAQLRQAVRAAALRTDVVDINHLPAEVVGGSRYRLTPIESLERDAIVGALAEPGTTVTRAAKQLGMSRATMYRKIAHFDIQMPHRGPS